MRLLRFLLLGVSILIILACGGSGGLSSLAGPKGVGFSSENPNIALSGQSVTLLVYGRVAATNENNADVTMTASTNVGTLSETTWTQTLLSGNALSYHALTLTLPANTAAGTAISIHVSRPVERIAGHPDIDEDILTMTVGASTITASLSPATVTGQAGQTVTSTLNLLPTGTAAGQVTLTSLVAGATVSPSHVTLTAGQTTPTPVTISYTIPAGTAVGTMYDLPIVYQSNAGHGGVLLHVTVTGQQNGSFTMSVSPATVHVQGQQVLESVQVTITPTGTFAGNVSIAFALPGSGSLTVAAPHTNPESIAITLGNPETLTVPLQYHPGVGTAPIGAATVTATGGGVTRTGAFNVTAS